MKVQRDKGRRPVRPRQLMLRIALVLLALVLAFLGNLYVERQIAIGQGDDSLRSGAGVGALMTARSLEVVEAVILAGTRIAVERTGPDGPIADPWSLQNALSVVVDARAAVADIGIYDPEGALVAAAGGGRYLPPRLADPQWLSPPPVAGSGRPVAGIALTTADGAPVVPVALRLPKGAGPECLVVAALRPSYFADIFNTYRRRETSIITLYDNRGRIVARTATDSLQPGNPSGGDMVAADEAAHPADGSRVGASAPVPGTGLSIAVTVARGELAAAWWQAKWSSITVFFAFLGVLGIGAVAFYRRLRDLERNRVDLALARDQANEANRAKSRFLAMMSHELRTPMAGVIGTLDLLRQTPLNREQAQYAQILNTSANALLDVLNDILDFSKIESAGVAIEAIDFNLDDVVNSTVDLFRARCEQKKITLRAVIADDVPRWLHGDPARLRQVLSNLVGNAAKFTDDGEITVRINRLPASPETLHFEVQDTGVGISSATQAMLFEPFVQADASTSRRFGGTGLGLAICRRLVKAMGGEIGVASAIGQGSLFWFTAHLRAGLSPARPSASVVAATVRPQPPADVQVPAAETLPRILVAEDNDINRFLIQEQLKRRNFDVTTVENGRKALEAHAARPFDLIVLDMRMPVMDGPTALGHIRALEGNAALVPVVALTADALPADKEVYLRSGVDALLTKPVDWKALEATLRRLLDTNKPAASAAPSAAAEAALPADLLRLGPANPDFDRRAIDELRDVMSDIAIAELIGSFRVTLAEESEKLHRAVAAGDAFHVREAAHTIQGMASQLGAAGITTVARSIRLDGPVPLPPGAIEQRLALYDTVVAATLDRLDAITERGAA
ncbi:ATP-binding protein [Zavarzinia sp.]|uniref:ATP-binding protein n=1 Tax=Zavarzinia sp. TaxID=2027920 RepID=UPI003564F831